MGGAWDHPIHVAAWKFHCDGTTRPECLRRGLVGGTDRMGEHDVRRGDTIFLHDDENGVVYGPFTAETEGLQTLVPEAWEEHRLDFPNQVRIDEGDQLYRIDTDSLSGLDRIAADDIFYDLSDDDADRLRTQLREHGTPVTIDDDDDGTPTETSPGDADRETDVTETLESIADRLTDRRLWQITPGRHSDLWPVWSEQSIASLEYTIEAEGEDTSRTDRIETIEAYDASEHDRGEYQAYLFQERLAQDDILVASEQRHSEVRVCGIGRVVAPYSAEHPTKLGRDHGADDHQVGVAWYTVADDGVAIDIDASTFPDHVFAPLDTDAFESILNALARVGSVDLTALQRRLGIDRSTGKERESTAVAIPTDPEAIPLDHLVFSETETLVGRVLGALEAGKHVILTGPPGTGKTALAEAIASVCAPERYTIATATADWTTFDTIGGYRPGRDGELDFAPGVFLEAFEGGQSRTESRWVIVDETNRCDIDKAFGSLFTALTGRTVTLPFVYDGRRIVVDGDRSASDRPTADHRYVIPEDWRMIATMNTFDKMSLYDLSYAFMRRFAFVRVPAPEPDDIDIGRLKRYVDAWSDIEDVSEYYRDVVNVWQTVNENESCKIGPAIVEDMLRFLQTTDGDLDGAVTMYVLPQLERLKTRQQVATIKALIDLDRPALDEGELRAFATDSFELTAADFERFTE